MSASLPFRSFGSQSLGGLMSKMSKAAYLPPPVPSSYKPGLQPVRPSVSVPPLPPSSPFNFPDAPKRFVPASILPSNSTPSFPIFQKTTWNAANRQADASLDLTGSFDESKEKKAEKPHFWSHETYEPDMKAPDMSITMEFVEETLGKRLFAVLKPHQKDCLLFTCQRHFRTMGALAMGMGKTLVMFCLLIICVKDLPVLIVTRGGIVGTIVLEMIKWSKYIDQAFSLNDILILEGKDSLAQAGKGLDTKTMKSIRKELEHQEFFGDRDPDDIEPEELERAARKSDKRHLKRKKKPPTKLIYVISQDQMKIQEEWILEKKFQLVFMDESHYMKNDASQMHQTGRRICANARVAINFTGTPCTKGHLDLWGQFMLNAPTLFPDKEYFLKYYCWAKDVVTTTGYTTTVYSGYKNKERLNEYLSKWYWFRKKGDATLLPKIHRRIDYIHLKQAYEDTCMEHRKAYKDKNKELTDLAKEISLREKEKRATQATASASGRTLIDSDDLKQSQNTARNDAKAIRSKAYNYLATCKRKPMMVRLLAYLDEIFAKKEKALIWAHRTVTLNLIKTEMELKGVPYVFIDGNVTDKSKRNEAMMKFESPTSVYKVAILSLQAASEGITMIQANHSIFTEVVDMAGTMEQAAARCWRIGQTKDCFMKYIIVKNSVEEDAMDGILYNIASCAQVVDKEKIDMKQWVEKVGMVRPKDFEGEGEEGDENDGGEGKDDEDRASPAIKKRKRNLEKDKDQETEPRTPKKPKASSVPSPPSKKRKQEAEGQEGEQEEEDSFMADPEEDEIIDSPTYQVPNKRQKAHVTKQTKAQLELKKMGELAKLVNLYNNPDDNETTETNNKIEETSFWVMLNAKKSCPY